jgi:hypothetical protein
MDSENQQDKVIEQLEALNEKLEKQISVRWNLYIGIIYGIGFFIGSAILATIALGIFGPTVAKIPWIQDNFTRGETILHPTPNSQQ